MRELKRDSPHISLSTGHDHSLCTSTLPHFPPLLLPLSLSVDLLSGPALGVLLYGNGTEHFRAHCQALISRAHQLQGSGGAQGSPELSIVLDLPFVYSHICMRYFEARTTGGVLFVPPPRLFGRCPPHRR